METFIVLGLCFMLYEALDLFQSCYGGNKSTPSAATSAGAPSSSTDDGGAKRNLILATVPEATDGDDDDDDDASCSSSFVDVQLGGDDTQQLLSATEGIGKNAATVFSISATIE